VVRFPIFNLIGCAHAPLASSLRRASMKVYKLTHQRMTRAKFWCQKISKTKMGQQGEIGTEVELAAVYDGSDEYKKYFRCTPNGKITLGILNPEAAAIFEPGREYYVDFTPAEK
jgi:hypothetical protein